MNFNMEKKSNDPNYSVPSLQRTLDIFEALMKHSDGLTLAEMQTTLGYPKSSLFRITQVLTENEYLNRCEFTNRFTLSNKFLHLGLSTLREKRIIEDSLIYMRDLKERSGETILLGTLADSEGILLEQVLGTEPFIFMLQPGKKFNLHASVLGKCMIAFLPDLEREKMIEKITFTKYNKNTITNTDTFRQHLAMIKEKGYAVDRAEEYDGIHCIGAPIFDQYAYPIACIWVTAPSKRLPMKDFDDIGKIFRDTANAISQKYGYVAELEKK